MEKLKQMKEALVGCVQTQVYGNMDKVDAKELGEAIDMIKDLSEAIYYCTIAEAMEKEDKEGKEHGNQHGMMYYNQRITPMYSTMPIEYYDPRYRERSMPMYAQGNGGYSNGGNSGSNTNGGSSARGGNVRGYREGLMPMDYYPMYDENMMRDPREGKSGERRKMYMEGKGSKDKSYQMKELENYMQELSQDLTDMIQDASPEEKQLLQ